jgi:hypothetical protein
MKKKYQTGSPVSLDPTTNLPEENNTGINWQIKKENPFKRINTVGKQSLSTSGVTTRGDVDRYSRLQRPFKLDEPGLSGAQAKAQPWTDQLGNWAVQTLQGEILGGTMQGFGAIYEAGDNLVRWGLRKGGIDVEPGDFSNKFMEWGTDLQKSARDKFPIYLENPNQAWSMSDPGWWFSNGVSIASSLSLMIPGMAVTRGIGYLAKTAGKTMPFWAQVGTNAVVMRNGENYREGLDVVNRTRSDAMDQFLNLEDQEWNLLSNSKLAQQLKSEGKWSTDEYSNKKALADRIAGAAGFESYKVNSTNIVFDIVQSALAVRAFSGMAGAGKLRSPKPKVVEANATAAGRELTSKQLRAAYANYYLNPANSLVAGSLTEYPEEVINFIGTEEGIRKGRVLMGKEREEATTKGSRISKYLKDPHAHEAGFFGVFGGGIYQKASQGAGTLINNYKGRKNPYSPDSKIAEIEGRAIKMGDTSARMQAVAAKENHPVYGDFSNLTDEQAEAIVNDLRQDLGRELGITSAAHGNEKLLKKMVNMPEYKQLLIDNGIVSEEDIDAYLPVLNENIDQGVRDYYAARKRAQKHNLGLKGYSKLLNEDLMVAGLLQKRLKQSSDVASKINELKTASQYGDQGYKFLLNKGENQADLDLALQLEGAKKALSYFQFEQENLQSTIEELDSKVSDHLADKVGRARARVQELTEQAEGKELPSLDEVSDELRELHRDQEVFNAEGSQLAQMLGKMHKPENVQQAEEQREEEDKQKTADRTKRLRDEIKTNVRNPQRIKEEIERIESLRAAYEDLPGADKIIDDAIAKLNNRLKTQEAKKAAKKAEANPTQENEEVRRQNVNKVESPAETNEETANPTEQNEKVNDDAFVNIDINEMLAKEAQTTIEGSTRVFIPELVTKDDRDNTISETSVEAKLLSNEIKVGDQIEIFIQPSNRIGLNEGEQFTANNLPLAIRVNDVVIGYVNTISGKQNNIDALQARLDAIPNNYEDSAQFSDEAIESFETQKHNLNEQLTKIGKELEAIRKMREAAFAVYNPDLDQLAIGEQPIFSSTITEKTSGALITLDVPQSISYGAINGVDVFSKLEDTPLYYHDGANKYVITKVDNPDIEFTREGETSFYNADMGYTKGGFYMLLESPSGQQIPTRLTTRKINSEEIQRAAEILNELKQLVQSAGTMSVKTTPRIGELKDELNRITYVGKGGIELHNDRVDINISHGKKRYTAKMYFYGAPNTPQAGQALENFNISFLDSEGNQVRESLFNENAAAINQAISNILVNSYKSVVVKDLQGENAEQYYEDLLKSDTFLTDVGKVKSENGNFISHFAAEGSGFKMQVGIDTKVTPVGKTKAPEQTVEVEVEAKEITETEGSQTSLDFDTQDDDLFTSAVVPEDTPSAKIKIDEAKAWLKENLPQVPLEVVEGLIETGGGYAWGTFHKGAIQLSDIAREGTEYHEAFHAVEHMYLNPIQRERVYKEARTVYGESLSDREIGEELAEEYREYQMMNGTSTFKLPSAIERFFGDIFRYIKHFISNGRSRTYTERLFKDISGGRFTNQPDQRAMDWAKSQDMIPRIAGLSRKEQKQAIDVITSLAHAIRERLVARGEASNAKVIYSRIKAGLKRNTAGKTIEQQDGISRVVDALGRKMKDSELWDKVSLRIQKDLNVVVKIDDTSISEEEKILAKQNWDDTANFEENHKDKTSAKIKLAIRTTKEVADYKDGKVILKSDNFMGMANFLDFNKVYPYLEKNLIGIRDPQHLLDRLTEMGKHDMSLLSLRDKIKNYKNSKGKNTLLAAFYHHFDKAAPNFTVNLLSRDNDTGMMVNQEFFSNNNNAYQNLAEGWQGVIEYKIENEQYDSSELEKKARQSRIAIQKMQKDGTFTPKSAADMISGMLSDIGITTFEQGQDVVSKALENAFVKEPAKAREVIKKYERIVANLKDNVFDNVGDLNFIGELVAPYKYDIIQNSAQTIDGKIYYGITKPNFMSDFYKKLQDPVVGPQIVDQLLKNPRTNESTIVKRMVEYKEGNVVRDNQNLPILNNAFVSSLGYSPQDGIKELGQREGLKYKAIQDVDWHSLNLLKFFDPNVNTVPNGFYASHLPIPSDSGQLYYVKVPKLTAQFGEGNALLKTSQVYRAIQQQTRAEKAAMKQAKDLLFDVVDGELSLKSLDQIYAKDNINQNRLIEHYHYKYNKAGEKVFLENGVPTGNVFKFYFLPAMNEDNGILRTNGVINEYLAEDAVAFEDSVIQNYVQDLANNMPLDFLDALNSIEVPRVEGNATQSGLTFLLNELVANEEMYNLFAGGQAFYKSATDLNKRMKQLISPGEKQSRMFTGETYKNGVIEDVIKPSAIIENKIDGLENWLKNYGGMRKNAKVNKENIINKKPSNDIEKEIYGMLENYLNIDTADGQGIVTVDRYLAQMEDIGRESDDLYKVVDAIKAGKELNRRDLKAILQPLKGFMYSNEYDSYLGMFVPRQVKYSTGVLVPQLVEGTEFDKIRKWMDSEKGTDELIFHSASKVGSRHVQKIHDDNGNIIEEALDQIHIEYISNDRWQKQLDIPDHVEDTTNTLGSQIAKLIMNNLSPNRIYTLAGDIAGEQRKFTGPELIEYYNQMLSENIIESHDKLMNRLDANESRTGFNNLLKVQDILQQELDRQESSEGMYEFINVDNKDNSKFEIPLAFGPNASKFESILTSLFTKNVTKQRFPGGTAVNFSSTFFKNAEVEETNELKMNVYESNGTKIIEAEAVLPAWSENFYRDGKLMDINKIPEELRTLITYRIPSAGKKAMIVIKAKEFSPKEMGNIIMLPNDFVVQSGMDFDIDKVNFMHKSFYVNKKDRFVIPKYGKVNQSTLEEDVSKNARNNEILDIYLSILTNPAHYAEVISPEAFADVTKAKENIQKVTGENDENIISGAYFDQNKLRKRNIAAKDLVGIAANYNQFTALSQIGQLRLIDDLGIKVKYPASKYKLSQLKARFGEAVKEGNDIIVTHKLINHTADGSQLNAEGKLVTEYSAQTLGASVDSVKDPSFETFNGNTYTYAMMGAMVAVGININTASYYLRQPIVKQITEKYFRNKGITSTQEGGERFEVRERYIKELLGNEYNKVQFNTPAKNELLVQRGVNIGEFTPFSESELLNNIKTSIEIGSISNMKDKNFIIDQLNIFENFMKLRQAGEAFDDLIRATKPEATGAGPSMTVTEELNAAQAKTYNYQGEEGPISRIVDKDGRDAIDLIYDPANAPMKVIPNMYKYSNGASTKLLKSQFPQYSPTISHLVDEINELIGKDYKSDRAKLIHNFVFAKLKHNNIDFVRNGRPYAEILGFTTEESTASKVAKLKAKYPKIASEQTELLGYLYPKVSKEDVAKNNGAQLIDVKYPADISTELEDSFHDMYHGRVPGLTAEQQQEFKDLARELILYSFHTTGLRAGRNSFAGLIIPSILNSPEIRFGDTMNEVAQAINNNSRQTLAVGETIFEFFQHNAYNRDVVPVGKKQWKTNSRGEFFIAKNSPRWEAQADGLIVEDRDKIIKAGLINSPFVLVPRYKDKKIESEILYFQAGASENDMIYVPVPKLGIRGKALNLSSEYMAHEDVYANIEEYDSINEAVEYAQLEYGAEEMIKMEKLIESIAEITRTKQSGC